MQGFARNLIENIKKIEQFAVYVFQFGLKLTIGLIMLSGLLYFLVGKYGNTLNTLICAKGALDAAQAMLIATVIATLISDIAIKDRAGKS